MDKLKAFLEELEQLTNKYGLIVGACGCCNSPYIHKKGELCNIAENLSFDEKSNEYTVEVTKYGRC